MTTYIVRIDLPGIEADTAEGAAETALECLRETGLAVGVRGLKNGTIRTEQHPKEPTDCPACHYRGGEPEGHAEWCDDHRWPSAAPEACERSRVRCAHCGWPASAHNPGVFQPHHYPKEEMDRLVEVEPLPGRTPGPGSDKLSLGGGGEAETGVGAEESGGDDGTPEPCLIQPVCSECSSRNVTLAHVYFEGGDVPAVVVLCSACRLAVVGQVDRTQLDDVIRRVRSTRSGDWRYRR